MTTTAIIPREPAAIAMLFQNGGAAIDPLLVRIETEVRSHVADLTSKKGRDAIASLAFKVSKSKTALDTAGKALTETQKREIKTVDDARKKIRDRLDVLRDEARKPLTDWENAEAEKVARQAHAMSELRNHGAEGWQEPAEIKAIADFIKAISLDGIEGAALEMAEESREHTLKELRTMYAAAVQREADAAELAALREAQQAQIEREQAAAIEAARIEAEREARAEQDREAERAEFARVAKIEADKLAAAQAEIDAIKAEAERVRIAEADKLAAVKTAKAEAQEAHDRQRKADADRLQVEVDAQATRDADVAHRVKVHRSISEAMSAMTGNATPDNIATALMEGKIPHTKVTL
jgi:hypothetical protein